MQKQEDFIQMHDEKALSVIREVIRYARKSIKIRKTLPGDDHKVS